MKAKEIIILHAACCAEGSPVKEQIEKVSNEAGVPVEIKELHELQDTMPYGTMNFPTMVIDGELFPYRSHHTDEQIKEILTK